MATHTITKVGPSNQWNGQQGSTFVDYKLRLDGVEKVVVLTQKPESPAPQDGQVIDVDLTPHPKFPDLLKAKRVQAQRSFSSNGSGHDDVTRRSIEAQVALKAAVEYETHKDTLAAANNGALGSSMDVTVTAGVFLDWLKGQS